MNVSSSASTSECTNQASAEFGPFLVRAEEGQLRLLAKAIGEQRPVYTSASSARDEGLPGVLGPPTLPFCLGMADDLLFQFLGKIGLDASRALHAGQKFHYRRLICAGDELKIVLRTLGMTTKKGGTLTFVEIEGAFLDAHTDDLVCNQTITLVFVPAQNRTHQ